VTLLWGSHPGPATTGTVTQTTGGSYYGTLERVTIDPGSPAPTAAYDMTLTDSDGVDLLCGKGANLSATVTSIVAPFWTDGTTTRPLTLPVAGPLTLGITNAGASKVGSVRLIIRK
jgi:hypothetical protein